MTVRSRIWRLFGQEDINFLLTNRIPRRLATQFVGWLSRVEQPLIRDLSIGLWKLFSDLDLSEAKKRHFRSMHDCFTRELKDGARPVDRGADILVSPCDAIVGACGAIAGTQLYQTPVSLEGKLARMAAVTPEDVRRCADAVFRGDRLVVAAVGQLERGNKGLREVRNLVESYR